MEKSLQKIRSNKMGFRKGVCFSLLILLTSVFISCATTFSEKNVLEAELMNDKNGKVYILDENNHGVEGVRYRLISADKNRKCIEGFTSEEGSLVIPAGKWILSGEKKNFSRIVNQLLKVNENELFFLKIKSAERMISDVLKLYEIEDFNTGMELLNQISWNKGSALEQVILFYRETGMQQVEKNKEENYEKE